MTVSQGDIIFVGINTAGAGTGTDQDWFAFAAVKNIAAGEVVYFTDNELATSASTAFNGSPTGGESYIKWVAPAGGVAAGTVIQVQVLGSQTNPPVASTGTASWVTSAGSANPGLSSTADSIYAFTAASDATVNTPTSFLAFINIGNVADPVPAGLAAAYATVFTDGSDNAYYSGLHSGYPDLAAYVSLIGNTANWTKTTGDLLYGANQSAALVATPPSSLSVNSVSAAEGNSGTKVLTFTVTLSSASVQTVTVDYATVDGTATTGGSDYVAASGTLTFAPGQTSKTVSVTLTGDTALEDNETFTLHLSNAVNGTIVTADGTGTIVNDDVTVQGSDHYVVDAGTTLSASSTPLTWNEAVASTASGPVMVENFGTIQSTAGTAIGATATAPASGQARFELWNYGLVTGAINGIAITNNSRGGSVTIVNAGEAIIEGVTGRAIDLTATASGGALSVINFSGGVIRSANDAVRVSYAGTFGGSLNIDNTGMIQTLGAGSGQGVDLAGLNAANLGQVSVNNWGTIIAADNDGVRLGSNGVLNNSGAIAGNSLGGTGSDGVDYQSSADVQIITYEGSTIDGARHGVTGKLPALFDNAGTITGHAGSGINLDTLADTVTSIVNQVTGTIVGTADGLADGDGVDVDGAVDLTNHGMIRALGHTDGQTTEGLAIGGGTVVNNGTIYSDERGIKVDDSNQGNAFAALSLTNHGTITGAGGEAVVIISAFDNTLINDGTIGGSVTLGSGNDVLTNTGSISGVIHAGAGNDTITAGGGDQTVDGGTGDDSIDGGAGNDIAIFAGNIADAAIVRVGDTFTVTTVDGTDTLTNVERFQFADGTLVVLGGNVAPTLSGAQAVLAHGTEDVAFTVTAAQLLAGFTDANGDTLSVEAVTADFADVADNGNGTWTLTPNANVSGTITIGYTVTDGHGGSTAASLGAVFDPVNDAPALTGAQAVLADGTEDVAYTVSAAALLTGYSDVDNASLAATNLVASNGTVTDNHDGTWTITPTADFNGGVVLGYDVTDGSSSVAATLGYTLAAVNDGPSALSLDTATVAENSAAGTLVGTVTAATADVGAGFTYTLLDTAGGSFVIDAVTGALRVAAGAVIDYETATSRSITVQVTDTAGASYHQAFAIAVTDVAEAQSWTGTRKGDVFDSINGNDWTLDGGLGNDVLTTHGGADRVTGGKGNDVIATGAGNDVILIGEKAGTDSIDGGLGHDIVQATAGKVAITLSSFAGIEAFSSGGFAGVTIDGGKLADVFDFTDVTLTGIAGIDGHSGNDTILGSSGADTILGGAGDDLLSGGLGADVLTGGGGSDRISGDLGADLLAGGGGNDIFVYRAAAESDATYGIDHIADFKAKKDVIDLSAIDANESLADNQAFTYIGKSDFTGLGQLRIGTDNGHIAIFGNVSGDLAADFEIILDTSAKISMSDFVL